MALAAQLEEAVHGEPLDEGVKDMFRALNKAVIRAFDKWEKKNDPFGHRLRVSRRERRAASEKFLREHPEIVKAAEKARASIGTWDRFKSQFKEVYEAIGSIGNDIIDVLQGLIQI